MELWIKETIEELRVQSQSQLNNSAADELAQIKATCEILQEQLLEKTLPVPTKDVVNIGTDTSDLPKSEPTQKCQFPQVTVPTDAPLLEMASELAEKLKACENMCADKELENKVLAEKNVELKEELAFVRDERVCDKADIEDVRSENSSLRDQLRDLSFKSDELCRRSFIINVPFFVMQYLPTHFLYGENIAVGYV